MEEMKHNSKDPNPGKFAPKGIIFGIHRKDLCLKGCSIIMAVAPIKIL